MKINNRKDIIKKSLKYIAQLLIIFVAAKFIPENKITFKEITIIAIIGAVSFAVLDLYAPSISEDCQKQIGLTIGLRTIGTNIV